MWTVLILLAPAAFAGVTCVVCAIGLVRNALIALRLRALDAFAAADGARASPRHAAIPDLVEEHALAGIVTPDTTLRAFEGTLGGRRFAAFAAVRAVDGVKFDWASFDLTGLAGRACFVAVAVECAGAAPKRCASLRRQLDSWHVAVGANSVVAWRERPACADDLAAAMRALLSETGTRAGA